MEEKNIELRSEKVRSIIGNIPPATVRYGIVVIFAVLFAIIGILAIIPYHETIKFNIGR